MRRCEGSGRRGWEVPMVPSPFQPHRWGQGCWTSPGPRGEWELHGHQGCSQRMHWVCGTEPLPALGSSVAPDLSDTEVSLELL